MPNPLVRRREYERAVRPPTPLQIESLEYRKNPTASTRGDGNADGGEPIQATTEFAHVDLRGWSLAAADLHDCVLTGSNLSGVDLACADLRGAVLTDAKRLTESSLRGCLLDGAALPEDVAKFGGLGQAADELRSISALFLSFLVACGYTAVTVATTPDAQLLLGGGAVKLPVVGVEVSPLYVYFAAPIVLLALAMNLLYSLQRYWEDVARLPATFPDGRRAEQRLPPVLVNALLSRHTPPGGRGGCLLAAHALVVGYLVHWLLPTVLAFAWLKYLPRHEVVGTRWLYGCTVAGVALGMLATRSSASALRLVVSRLHMLLRVSALASGALVLVAMALATPWATSGMMSEWAVAKDEWQPRGATSSAPPSRWHRLDRRLRNYARLAGSAKLERSQVSGPPAAPRAGERPTPTCGASLANYSLVGALASGAALANCDFRGADLRSADLKYADLRGSRFSGKPPTAGVVSQRAVLDAEALPVAISCLEYADLGGADLSGADLSYIDLHRLAGDFPKQMARAILRGSCLDRTDIRYCNLEGADLSHCSVSGTSFGGSHLDGASLLYLEYNGADGGTPNFAQASLRDARLAGWFRRIDFSGADMNCAHLRGDFVSCEFARADLSGADLIEARHLTPESLQGANLSGAKVTRQQMEELSAARFKGTPAVQ